jgi:hypothetical protein
MKISRLTIDKLGVKLYDKASAVVSELVANSYDADAKSVIIDIPLGTELSPSEKHQRTRDQQDSRANEKDNPARAGIFGSEFRADKECTDVAGIPSSPVYGTLNQGRLAPTDAPAPTWEIVVVDDGQGMTPSEAQDFYMNVGGDRRTRPKDGNRTRDLNRQVMGRKGIGKLAPFGICRQIEVVSAGGEPDEHGYLTSHFILNYEKIVRDEDGDVPLDTGSRDRTRSSKRGTTVYLRQFLPKRVPDRDTFHRQLARRFGRLETFDIQIRNLRDTNSVLERLAEFSVPIMPGTEIRLEGRPVITGNGDKLPVSGLIGMAKESYRNPEMAGVRIYARNKIVGTTRDFGRSAGFTGEFMARSYLVGEIHADWLDDDEDLVRTDRQDILWDSDYGEALQEYGARLIKEVAQKSNAPRRENTARMFLRKSDITTRAQNIFEDESVIKAATDLGKRIGACASEDELQLQEYVDDLSDIVLSVAPHKALMDAFRAFAAEVGVDGADSIGRLADLFGKTRVAEFASYAQIADERVRSIVELETALDKDVAESELQKIISNAPWLIRADWTVLTTNESFATFKRKFGKVFPGETSPTAQLTLDHPRRRPDFILVNFGDGVHAIEIKAPNHGFDNADFDRLFAYVETFDQLAKESPMMLEACGGRWEINLVADGIAISNTQKERLFQSWIKDRVVVHTTWSDFLHRARVSHEQFLQTHASARQRQLSDNVKEGDRR